MSSTIVPAPGWILIRRNLPAKTTASGIHIPETARSRNPGITPGESSKVEVLAVSDMDTDNGPVVSYRDTDCVVPSVGDTVFVLAQHDNLVPVVTDEYGQVEMAQGFQVPDTYLIKLTAVAGVIAKDAHADEKNAANNMRSFLQSAVDNMDQSKLDTINQQRQSAALVDRRTIEDVQGKKS